MQQSIRPRKAGLGEIFSWTLFDFANTGFYVIIITLIFPVYFRTTIAGGNDAYWGRTIAASMLITAVIGPFLGSLADVTHKKKFFLGLFTIACVLATFGLYFTGAGTLMLAVVLLVIANVGFEGGTIFYDAFLPDIAEPKDYGKISGYGFAMGYLGSFVILLTVLPIVSGPDVPESSVRLTFLIAGAFFAVASLPLFLVVKERAEGDEVRGNLFEIGYGRLRETLSHLRRYDSIRKFLLAFFVYNDSILTVILFAGIFASETLKLDTRNLIFFFMIVQGSALVGSLIFGWITNLIGVRQSIVITLLIWIAIVLGAAFWVTDAEQFFILGGVAGLALGSSQSCSRTMMALLTPPEKRTEFFGFYDGFFGKASAVIGPLVFGEVSQRYGQRPAMLILGGMFILGMILILRTPDVRAQRELS